VTRCRSSPPGARPFCWIQADPGAGTFRLRCRRGSCVSLFLEPRYSATPRSRDLPPSLRSRRNAPHHCELQAAGTLVQAGISDSGICGAGGDSAKLRRRSQAAGEAFDFGGVQVSVLNPRVGESAANPAQDDESMLLRFEFRESSALLVGDAHKRTGSLLEGENPRADLQNRAPRQRDIQFTRLPAGGCVAVRGGISWVLQHVPPPAARYHEALR